MPRSWFGKTGFDNIQIAEFSSPSLTTINIPRERIASTLFRSLWAAEGRADEPATLYTIDPELIVRESTGVAPRDPTFRTELSS